MTYAEKNIIETYASLFEGLNSFSKIELLKRLVNSLEKDHEKQKSTFFKSFGAFASEQSAEEIMAEIKNSRKFRKKDLDF